MLANRGRTKVMMVTNGSYRKNFFGFMPLDTIWHAGDRLVNDTIVCSKPCHGLNLISTSTDDYLCNPCTGSIRCLGIAGKLTLLSEAAVSIRRRHAFTVGGSRRSVGLGFDRLTHEHVVVEITRSRGALACMLKSSCVEYWSHVGAPPRPVTDMPPAHVNGVLYWMSEPQPQTDAGDRVVVAFDIPTRAFSILPSCSTVDAADPFLVELQGLLSLVVPNTEEDELQIWMMREHGTWFSAYKICLQNQPYFSLSQEENVVVPLEIDSKTGRILLNTGRALGYYDTRTCTLDLLYSLDQLHLPRCNLAFPMLYLDNLIRIQDDEIPDHVTQPLCNEGGQSGKLRYVFRSCEKNGCESPGALYTGCCCRRVLCFECSKRCAEHTKDFHTTIPCIPRHIAKTICEYLRLPLEHMYVPSSEYCYYKSMRDDEDDDVGRQIFVSLKDLARGRQPYRMIECGYRMNREAVMETWIRRYREEDRGF
jgi:F-box interacting protein